MSLDLRELYQEVILDHNRHPRNKRKVESPTGQAEGFNPVCGDQVEVTILTEDGVVKDIAFQGHGCAISTASASMMTELLKGKTVEEAEATFRQFQKMVTNEGEAGADFGDLELLAGVREYPVRIKCATLPWHAFHAALHGQDVASTE